MHKVYFATVIALLLTVVDTVLKIIITNTLPHGSVVLIPNVLALKLHMNSGIIADTPLPMPVVIVLSVAILAGLTVWLKKSWEEHQVRTSIGIAVLISGGIGNLTDRLANGITTDYILLFERSVANIADGIIIVGILILLFSTHSKKKVEIPRLT